MLPIGGLSILSARPKVGKSTLARCLGMSVARGRRWLGREVMSGAVLYLALEEHGRMLLEHFQKMGLREEDPLHVHVGPPPPNGIPWIGKTIEQCTPALVIIDPIMHLIPGVKDLNDYAAVTGALRPFLNMARASRTHVMLVHHNTKIKGDQGREILGSTALLGIVDCAISLDDDSRFRSMYSRQRYGEDCEPTELRLEENGRGSRPAGVWRLSIQWNWRTRFLNSSKAGRSQPTRTPSARRSGGRRPW